MTKNKHFLLNLLLRFANALNPGHKLMDLILDTSELDLTYVHVSCGETTKAINVWLTLPLHFS